MNFLLSPQPEHPVSGASEAENAGVLTFQLCIVCCNTFIIVTVQRKIKPFSTN